MNAPTDNPTSRRSRLAGIGVALLLIAVLGATFAATCTLYGTPVFRMKGDARANDLPWWQAAGDDHWYGLGIVDEGAHYDEVMRIGRNLPHTPGQATIPGYHATIAVLCKLAGTWQLPWVRYWHFLVCLGVILLWGCMIRREGGTIPVNRFLQFVFMPIFCILYFVVYTDIMALGLVLLAYEFNRRKRYVDSGVAGILAVLVRQTMFPWVAFLGVLTLVRENRWRPTRANLRWVLDRCWTYLLCAALFGGFLVLHGDVTVNRIEGHPPLSLHLGNLWFFVVVHVIVFLPLHVRHAPAVWHRYFRDWKRALVTLLPGILIYWPYILFYEWTHSWNVGTGFVRNEIIRWREYSTLNMTIMLAVVYYGVLALSTMRFRRRCQYLLWLFAALSVLPIWVIEQRYYLPIVALFMLFRREEDRRTEIVLTAWIFLLGMLALFGLISQHYFL